MRKSGIRLGPISSSSFLTDCSVPGCRMVGIIQVLRRAEGEAELRLCTAHYHHLIRRMRDQDMDEEDVDRLSNIEVHALLSDSEFKRTMAKLIADARFRQIIRERARKRK